MSMGIKARKRAPAHVPPERLYDFDLFGDPMPFGGAHKMNHDLIGKAPDLFYTLRDGGHWMVTRRKLIEEVMAQPNTFSSHAASPHFDTVIGRIKTPPQDMDPPEHMAHRLLLMKFLGPKHIRALEGRIRRLMVELIDAVLADGGCDFVAAVAVPFPVKTFMSMMQWDLSRYADFAGWAQGIIHSGSPMRSLPYFIRMRWFLKSWIRDRQRNPGDDPVSLLLASEVGGKKLTPALVLDMANLLFLGGLDTVTIGLSFITLHLAQHPALQQRLRDNPGDIPAAIDELLRRYAFVSVPRRVDQDVTLDGVLLKKGDYIVCSLPDASNDEEALGTSAEVDIDRRNAPSLIAFNTGPHSCAGAALARLALRIFLEEWLSRVPPFRLIDDYTPRQMSGALFALKDLKLAWQAG